MQIPKMTFIALFLSAATFPSEARAQEPSVFEVFKTFCIDTDIEKAAISAKAASLGALPFKPPEGEMGNLLVNLAGIQESKAAWLAKLGTHQFEVYVTATDPASPAQHAGHTDVCRVIFRGEDAHVVDDFDHWIDIPDSETVKLPPLAEKIFEFEIIDGKQVPLPKTWRLDPTYSKKVIWTAEVSQWRATSLTLERTKPF
jgi:hypothetical protein